MVPIISKYKIPAQIVGGIALGLGLYLEGGLAYKQKADLQAAEIKAKLATAQVVSAQKNTEIQTKIMTKTQIIHDKGEAIIKYIEGDAAAINSECVLPTEAIDIHNKAAQITAGEPK